MQDPSPKDALGLMDDQGKNGASFPSTSTPRLLPAREKKVNEPSQQPQYLFINSPSMPPRKRRYVGDRNVRSFVMIKARRERCWSTKKQPRKQQKQPRKHNSPREGSPARSDRAIVPLASKQRPNAKNVMTNDPDTAPCSTCERLPSLPSSEDCAQCHSHIELSAQMNRPFPSSAIDPFDNFPVPVDSRTSLLWDHFFSSMAADSVPVDVYRRSSILRSGWFTAALTSEALMLSVLCSIALHRYIVGKGPPQDVCYFKARAVSAVNVMLSDPESRISDANIGAVFNLLCVEESFILPILREGRAEKEEGDRRLIHLSGLKEMVRMRGGVKALESSKSLQSYMMRHSATHSIASFYPPYISWYDTYKDTCQYLSSAHNGTSRYPKFRRLCNDLALDPDLVELVGALSAYVAELNDWYADETATASATTINATGAAATVARDPIHLQQIASYFECHLVEWLNGHPASSPPSSPSTAHDPASTSISIALLCFVVLATESPDPRLQPLHFTATPSLRRALAAAPPAAWSAAPELLLWQLAVGAAAARGSADERWFARRLAAQCARHGVASADALVWCLEDCLWVGFRLEGPVRRAWAEAAELEPGEG